MNPTYEGWAPDPFDAHEVRYFVDGRPTKLVRDGSVESFDDLPPRSTWPPILSEDQATTEQAVETMTEQPVEAIPDQTVEAMTEQPVEAMTEQPVEAMAPAPPPSSPPPSLPPPPPAPSPLLTPPPPPPGASYWSPPPAPVVPIGQQVDVAATDASAVHRLGESADFAVGPADTFVGGAEATPTRRPRKRVVTTLVALVVLAALGSIVAVVTGGTSAQAAVIDSVNSTMADQTAHITMNLSAHIPTATVTGTGTGGIDFSRNAMQLQMSAGVDGQQINVQAVYIDGSVYENIPGLDQVIPGKSWISVDLSSLGGSTSQSPSSLGTGDNPAAMLRLLTQQGNTVVPLGSSTVDGTSVQGYSVTLDSTAIEGELARAKLPSWMTSALRDVDIQDSTFKVYVDGAGLLRRMTVGFTESIGSVGKVSVDETLDLSDYGSAVTVSAPPPDQVATLQQVLAAAQAAGTSST